MGNRSRRTARLVKTDGSQKVFDASSFDKAEGLAGWKCYVTNIEAKTMTAREVVSSYHDLWDVEQSFGCRRPTCEPARSSTAPEAYLTVVFTVLALARFVEEATGCR